MADDKKGGMKDFVAAESMVQVALALPVGCLLGWLGGSWLDGKLHQHWIGIVGAMLGAVGGFIQIVKVASQSMKGRP